MLCGHRFRISDKSFYQINSEQCEKLYNIAMEYAGLDGKQSVLDAYSGIGTIGITAARLSHSVVGIELNPDAVADAQYNAKNNNITKARFLQGDAGEFMVEQAQAGKKYDVVFMNPPRAGSSKTFLGAIAKACPDKDVYTASRKLWPETLRSLQSVDT